MERFIHLQVFFFEEIERISQQNYIPSKQDVIRVRIQTSGIVDQKFTVNNVEFEMLDVGGQQNQRRKWIHCFENVDGVLFVASLSGYNEGMSEDREKNRLSDSIKLFSEICNSRWFRDSAMILFLNKRDIFERRIKEVALTNCPEFEDLHPEKANNYKYALNEIKKKFKAQNKTDRDVLAFETVAIDEQNVEHIFNAVSLQVLRDNLEKSGLGAY